MSKQSQTPSRGLQLSVRTIELFLGGYSQGLIKWIKSECATVNIVIVEAASDYPLITHGISEHDDYQMFHIKAAGSVGGVKTSLIARRLPEAAMMMPLSASLVNIDPSVLDEGQVCPVWVFADEAKKIAEQYLKDVEKLAKQAKKRYKK